MPMSLPLIPERAPKSFGRNNAPGTEAAAEQSYHYNDGIISVSNSSMDSMGISSPAWQTYSTWYHPGRIFFLAQGEGDAPVTAVDEPSRSMLKRVAVPAEEMNLSGPDAMDMDCKLAVEAEAVLGYQPLRQALHVPGRLRRALAKLEISVLDQESVDAYKAQMADHYQTTNKMLAPTWRLTPLAEYTQEVPKFVLRKAVEIKRELPEAHLYVDQLAVDPFLIVSVAAIADPPINCKRALDADTSAYIEVWSEPKFEATV